MFFLPVHADFYCFHCTVSLSTLFQNKPLLMETAFRSGPPRNDLCFHLEPRATYINYFWCHSINLEIKEISKWSSKAYKIIISGTEKNGMHHFQKRIVPTGTLRYLSGITGLWYSFHFHSLLTFPSIFLLNMNYYYYHFYSVKELGFLSHIYKFYK